MILDLAYQRHVAACEPYRVWLDPRLAHPFGTPPDMPPHRWRVSPDVFQALAYAAPPTVGPNPKNGDDGTCRLFGWPVDVDESAPPGTMVLAPTG